MAVLNFPSSPTNGQQYTGDNGVTYQYDSATTKWVVLAATLATSHTHVIGDVTGLQTALDGKAATSHTHLLADITDYSAASYPDPANYSAAGDGSTNDTTAFTNLEAAFPGKTVDLGGKVYVVNAIPTGCRYINGAFKVSGLCYAMPGTFELYGGALPRLNDGQGNSVNGAFQGAGYSWNDRIGLFYVQGATELSAGPIVHTYSVDGGLNWVPPFNELQQSGAVSPAANTGMSMHYVTNGFVWRNRYGIITKFDNNDDYRYFTKPVPRYEVLKVTAATVSSTKTITITWPNHGLRSTEIVNVQKFQNTTGGTGAVIGGITSSMVSGAREVTRIDSNTFSIQSDTNATSTASSSTIFLGLRFPNTAWTELLYTPEGGGSVINIERKMIEQFDLDPSTATGNAKGITIVQGYGVGSSGELLVPVVGREEDGTTLTAFIARIPNPQDSTNGTNLFTKRALFDRGTGDDLTEPSIAYERNAGDEWDGTGHIFGFLRTQDPAVEKPQFWFSTNSGTTITQGPISLAIMDRSPIPCQLGDDGYIYGFGTERMTDSTGDPEYVNMYLLRGKKTDVFAAGANCGLEFDIYVIGDVNPLTFQGNDVNPSAEASNTGRPSAVKHGSWIYFFYEEEEYNNRRYGDSPESYANIKYIAINTDPTHKEYFSKRGYFKR
jgi:Phage tail repeat like